MGRPRRRAPRSSLVPSPALSLVPSPPGFGLVGAQGNRVKNSCGDQTCEEVVVPSGDFSPEAQGILAGAFRIRLWAMCLMVVKLAGA